MGSFAEFFYNGIHDALACVAVAVGVGGTAHTVIFRLIGEQAHSFSIDNVGIGTHQLQCSRFNTLGTFGGVTKHENGLAEGGSLLLDTAAVGQYEVGDVLEIMEIENLQVDNSNCKKEFSMNSENSKLWCEHCKKEWEMDYYGQLHCLNGEETFTHVPDWYNWQRMNAGSMKRNGELLIWERKIHLYLSICHILNRLHLA